MCAWPALQCQEPDLTIFFRCPIDATTPQNTHRTLSRLFLFSDSEPDHDVVLCAFVRPGSRVCCPPETAPLPSLLLDDFAAAQQGWIEHNQARFTAFEKGRLRPGQWVKPPEYSVIAGRY